jgi:hypothetical protein
MKENGFAHLFLIVVIVLAGLGGLLYYSQQKGLIKTSPPNQQITNSPLNNSDILENWMVYTSSDCGFEFKYPSSWFIANHEQYPYPETRFFKRGIEPNFSDGDHGGNEVMILFPCGKETRTIDQIIENRKDINSIIKSYTINKIIVRDKNGFRDSTNRIVILFDNNSVEIDFSNQEARDVIDQILSTFKFADQAESSALRVDCSGMAEGTGITYLGSYFLGSQCAFNKRQECEAADVVFLNGNKLDEAWGQDGTHDCVWFEENDPLNRCKPKYYCGS